MHEWFYKSKRWLAAQKARKRIDGYRCHECAKYGRTVTERLLVHHKIYVEDLLVFIKAGFAMNTVVPIADRGLTRREAEGLLYDMDNLVTLCRSCHMKAHPEKNIKANCR